MKDGRKPGSGRERWLLRVLAHMTIPERIRFMVRYAKVMTMRQKEKQERAAVGQ